jgi:hypothetical protein
MIPAAIFTIWLFLITCWPEAKTIKAFTTFHAMLSAGMATVVVFLPVDWLIAWPLLPLFMIDFLVFIWKPKGAFLEVYERSMGYAFRLSMVPAAFVASTLSIDLFAWSVAFVVACQAAIVIYQRHTKRKLGYNPKMGQRTVGTLGNPIQTGDFLAVGLFFQAYFITTPFYLISVALMPITIYALTLTRGRSPVIAILAGSFILIAHGLGPMALLMAIPILALASLNRQEWKCEARLDYWKYAFKRKIKEWWKPSGMCSVERFMATTPELRKRTLTLRTDRTHNWFLDLFIEGGIWYPAYIIYISVFAIIFLPPLLSAALVCWLVGQFFAFPFQGNYMLWIGLVAVGLPFKISSVPLFVLAPAMIIAFVLYLLAVIAARIIRKQPKSWLDAYFKLRLANLMCPYLHYRMSAQIMANPRLFDKESLKSEIDRLKKSKSLPYGLDSARVRIAMLALLGEKETAKKEVTEYLSEFPGDPQLMRMKAHVTGEGLQETLEKIVTEFETVYHKSWSYESVFWLELLVVTIKSDKRRAQKIADRMIKRHGEEARRAIKEFNKRLREQAKQKSTEENRATKSSDTASTDGE